MILVGAPATRRARRTLPRARRSEGAPTPDGPLDDTVPARPINVRDLLTFRLRNGIISPSDAQIQQALNELGSSASGRPTWHRRTNRTMDPPPRTLPPHQPGEQWTYGTGIFYVLGVLIARASGQPLEAFLRQRIFEPLGMTDTAFSVPAAKRDRLASAYRAKLPRPAHSCSSMA